MTSAEASVVIASASAVAKVFVISLVGYCAVKRPKQRPLIPFDAVGVISRMAFYLFFIPLIYVEFASTMSISVLSDLWFMSAAAAVVIPVSFIIPTVLGMIIKVEDPTNFEALRISATFPTVVFLPVLIFPMLCEYELVYETVIDLDADATKEEKSLACEESASTMIYTYFIMWTILFFSFGYQRLLNVGRRREQAAPVASIHSESPIFDEGIESTSNLSVNEQSEGNPDLSIRNAPEQPQMPPDANNDDVTINQHICSTKSFVETIKRTITNSGFVAVVLGLITALITPLQSALFSPGGPLRFLGSALETLGQTTHAMVTMIVAASFVRQQEFSVADEHSAQPPSSSSDLESMSTEGAVTRQPCSKETPLTSTPLADFAEAAISDHEDATGTQVTSNDGSQNPSLLEKYLLKAREISIFLGTVTRSRHSHLYIWYILSRLIVTPAVVCGTLIGLDRSGVLSDVQPLEKIVVLVNAAVPGAMIPVVVLKSEGLGELASIVASVYIPCYLLSVLTVTGWTAAGLAIFIPGD